MKIEFNLDDIDKLEQFIEAYMKKIYESTDEIAKRLVEIGIETAQQNVIPEYASSIYFMKEEKVTKSKDITKVNYVISGRDNPIHQEWLNASGNVESYEISPLLLSEFGSGWLSDVKYDGMQGIVGQGTMPNSKGHAFDPMGWGWYDLNGKYHRSIGVRPTYPLYKAKVAMHERAEEIINQILFFEI